MKKMRFKKASENFASEVETLAEKFRMAVEEVKEEEENRLENYNEGTAAHEEIEDNIYGLEEILENLEDVGSLLLQSLGVEDFCSEKEIELWD